MAKSRQHDIPEEPAVTEESKQSSTPADENGQIKPRNPALALLLSLCPGLGQHYAGHLLRGIVCYVSLIVISWLAAILFMHVNSRISMVLLAVPFIGVAVIAWDAYRCAGKQPNDYTLQWFNKGWIYAGVFLALLVTVNPVMDQIAGQHIVRAYYISSPGMHPTILTQDIVLVNKMSSPGKGDIALIELGDQEKSPQLSNLKGSQLVGRIIGLPGDEAEINKEGVFINGEKLDEPYANFVEPTRTGSLYDEISHFGPKQVPDDAYFVLADNRTYGFDSRILGFIPQNQIGGKVTKVFWSWNHDDDRLKWERTAISLN